MKVESSKYFKQIKIDLAKRFRVQLSVFLICLFISIGIWLVIKLSKEYTEFTKIPVTYTHIPENQLLTGKVDSLLTIELRASGFELLSNILLGLTDTMRIDLSRLNLMEKNEHFEGYYTEFKLNELISNELEIKPRQIASVKPDTLMFKLYKAYKKVVPVSLNIELSFADQYFLYDSLKPEPEKVTLTGIKNDLITIESVESEPGRFKKMRGDQTLKVKLQRPKSTKFIHIDPGTVSVAVDVETYTESSTVVPIIHMNEDSTMMIKTFPQEVEITFLVALKDYKNIKPSMFAVGVDARKAFNLNLRQLNVSVMNTPDNVRITRIKPQKVEYIIIQ